MKLKSLNGNLFSWLRHMSLMKTYSESDIVNHEHRRLFFDMLEDSKKMVKESRANGYDWIFSKTDIKEDSDNVGVYVLPSVDIAEYIGTETNHSDKIETKFKEYGVDCSNIDWDTESSAWYPMFNTKDAAIKFIEELNLMFDALYFKKE
jgi:hypothetical protein